MSALVLLLFTPFSFGAVRGTASPSTTNNDDSCDIGVAPAATLLLPYFMVDLASRNGEQTVFTVTNVSNTEQVAHVTLWTDFAFPAFDFNIYLTGYDVQSINLYDVLTGRIAPPHGTGYSDSEPGPYSVPNPAINLSRCYDLPAEIPRAMLTRIQQAFTIGLLPAAGDAPACTNIGSSGHPLGAAIGYVTVDVVGSCTTLQPTQPEYYTQAIRFDNVLIGDYQQVNRGQSFAYGNPLVHIRAVPEDGPATNLRKTFYGRFQAAATPALDRRQPLPSTFAARWIAGGMGSFETNMKIWRDGRTPANAPCEKYKCNAKLQVVEFVTFDEDENGVGEAPEEGPVCTPIQLEFVTNAAFSARVGRRGVFPYLDNGAIGGWIYMNLANESVARQAWVISSMSAEGRYGVDMDATWLGNGCTEELAESEFNDGTAVIGPASNPTPP